MSTEGDDILVEALADIRSGNQICNSIVGAVLDDALKKVTLDVGSDPNSSSKSINSDISLNITTDTILKSITESIVHTLPNLVKNLDIFKCLQSQCEVNNSRLNLLDQYTRKNCLLLHAKKLLISPKLKGINYSKKVVEFLNSNFPNNALSKKLSVYDIDTSHPLHRKNRINNGKHIVIIKFVRRDLRNEVLANRKLLKRAGVTVTEHLTDYNLNLLKKAQELAGFKNAWSDQGIVFMKVEENTFKITCEADFPIFSASDLEMLSSPAELPDATALLKNTVKASHHHQQNSLNTPNNSQSKRSRKPFINQHSKKRKTKKPRYQPRKHSNFHDHNNFQTLIPMPQHNCWNRNASPSSNLINNQEWQNSPYATTSYYDENFPRCLSQNEAPNINIRDNLPPATSNYYNNYNTFTHQRVGNPGDTNLYWGGGYAGTLSSYR